MHTLKTILLSLSLVVSCSAYAEQGLTEANFNSEWAQLKKDVEAKRTFDEALAVIAAYSKALGVQTRVQHEIDNNDIYYRASEMYVRIRTILETECDDQAANLEFSDSMVNSQNTELSPDLKKAMELSRILCAKK